MTRRFAIALAAAAASAALAAPSPASAQTPEPPPACVPVPSCINYAFDTAAAGVRAAQEAGPTALETTQDVVTTGISTARDVIVEVGSKLDCIDCNPVDAVCWIVLGVDEPCDSLGARARR